MIEIEEKGYRSFVPICRTYAGDFFAGRQTENSYYLMPWLQYDQEEERDQKHVYLFKEVAKLHSATVRDIQIRTEDISGFYEATKRDWENDKLVYEQFADRAEKSGTFHLLNCRLLRILQKRFPPSILLWNVWKNGLRRQRTMTRRER